MSKLKPFACKQCGHEIKPPEIVPPMILGDRLADSEFTIKIEYACKSCGKSYRSSYVGKVLIAKIEILSFNTD